MNGTRPIATVTLNPAIDQTAAIPDFTAGTVNRVVDEQSDAGGKGVNVASFLADTGHAVAVTGFLGAENTELFDRMFVLKGIENQFIRLPGRTRVNIKIVDEVRKRVTDINFPGLAGSLGGVAALTEAVRALAERCDWFVLSGSVPAGVPVTIYRDLIALLKAGNRTVVLDSSGEPLACAIPDGTTGTSAAAPDIIKPNIDELQELVGRRLESEAAIVDAVRALLDRGIGLVAVSMGPDGAVFVAGREAVRAVPPAVTVRSTVGAGDAMVAGIVAARQRGLSLADCARLGTAYALGTLGEIGPRLPSLARIDTLMQQVTIHSLD